MHVEIHEQACRGCQMCVDICPTDVFEFSQDTQKATVSVVDDCIGCLSCAYDCPSGAITHQDVHLVKNFYRDMEFCERMEKYL